MAKCAFMYGSYSRGVTPSGSSTAAGLGYSRLADPQPSIRTRITHTAGALNFAYDFGAAQSVDTFVLVSTTLTEADTVRFRASTADPTFAVTVIDSSASSRTASKYNGTVVHIHSAPVSARYVRVDITSSPARDIDIGLCEVGLLWRPSRNFTWGAVEGALDFSKSTYNPDTGARFTVAGPRLRVKILTLQALTKTETRENLYDIDRLQGASGDILYVEDPAETAINLARDSIWGSYRELGGVDLTSRRYLSVFSRTFKMTERL